MKLTHVLAVALLVAEGSAIKLRDIGDLDLPELKDEHEI